MAKDKKKRVPEVLWRIFKARARTLAETILHFVPPQCSYNTTPQCSTKFKCLHCCFHQGSESNPISYLLRPDDPPDYHILLNRTFIVVSEDAPQLPSDSRSGVAHWSHLEIVRRTIQKILIEQPGSSNIICCGYDKLSKDMGPNAQLLISSAWDLVLQRVGERLLVYLLCHTSIFVPIPSGKYQQVAGSPVTGLVSKSRRRISEAVRKGSKRKRRKTEGSLSHEELSCVLSSQVEGSQTSSRLSDISETKRVGIFSGGEYKDEGSQLTELSDAKPTPRKYSRPPKWLRKRRKYLNSRDANIGIHMETSQPDTSITVRNDHINSEHASKEPKGSQNRHEFSVSQENMSLLSCCSIFQTSVGVPKGDQIKRPKLYNLESSTSLLPEKHVLNSLKVGFGGANYLIRNIFAMPKAHSRVLRNPCSQSKEFQSPGSTCMYHSFVKLVKVFICRAKRCKYEMLLDKHCPVPTWSQSDHVDASTGCRTRTTLPAKRPASSQPEINIPNKRSRTSTSSCNRSKMNVVDPQPCLNMCYNSRHQVVSFVWAACRSIVPSDLLGSTSSWRVMRRNISKFIQLRRFEKFSLKQCMFKLKMSEFSTFSSKSYLGCWKGQMQGCGNAESASSLMRRLFERWIFWLFSDIVAPIIQSHFYVTESEHGKQELYFYRKSIWKKINDQAIASLKAQSYKTISERYVRDILSKRPFGFSKLRLCPKEMGVRAIANLAAPSRYCKREFGMGVMMNQCRGMKRKARSCSGNDQFGYLKSVNHFLRDTHSVFRDLRIKEPENWGSSVFNYNDVYRKLCPFLMSVKKGMKDMPSIFIVVSDVEKAFDTVDQDKLLEIVDEILIKDKYLLQESHEIVCKKKSLWVDENSRLMNQQCAKMKSSLPSRSGNTIVIDQTKSRSVRKDKIFFYLNEHVKHNVLHVDQCFLMQGVGIPQGSSVSSLLCSLYFGYMERKRIFPFLKRVSGVDVSDPEINHVNEVDQNASQHKASEPTKYTLLRFLDDFLFISTSKRLAENFFSRLQIGFREYNCYMNKDKFSLNFDMSNITEIKPKSLVEGGDGNTFIQWSGLLINCHTLEIQADYTRYLNIHMSSTLTICWQGRPGRELKGKLCDYMRPKCHPLLFDLNINSPSTVRLNVYQMFLLSAMKFHCYVRELSSLNKFEPKFYFKAIDNSIRYTHMLIRKRMEAAATSSTNWKPVVPVCKRETIWLGLSAYIRVLNRKQSRYKQLLRLLRSELAAQGDSENCPWLMYAVDDIHSSCFWNMKF